MAQGALSQTQSEPQESQNKLDELQTSNREQIQKLQEELEKAWADRDAAIRELNQSFYDMFCWLLFFFRLFVKCCSGDLEDLVCNHKTVLLQKEQQALHLEEKGKQLQKEVRSLINYSF